MQNAQLSELTKLFFSHFYCTEKPFTKYLNNKFFSIYNYLFRFFFLYSVFNEHLCLFFVTFCVQKVTKETS